MAGYESELSSNIPLSAVKTEIGEFSGGASPQLPNNGALTPITRVSIGGTPTEFVYSLGNNDTLTTPQPNVVVNILNTGSVESAGVTTFNAATDVITLQSSQAANFSALSFSQVGTNQTDVGFGNHNEIYLQGVVPASLHSSNFAFV